MKIRYIGIAAIALASIVSANEANAQYWQAASQLQSLISPALSGSGRYKGSVELTGVAGIGSSKLNHVEIATSQGYQYTSWFYMGAGLGVDIVRSSVEQMDYATGDNPDNYIPDRYINSYGQKKTGVMIPLFTDFRFNIPTGNSPTAASVFVDLRLGASWLLGDTYLETNDGWLGNDTKFYFRPAIGARIPVNRNNPKQAVNIGIAYLLLTGGDNYGWSYGVTQTFSSIGATVSFEW